MRAAFRFAAGLCLLSGLAACATTAPGPSPHSHAQAVDPAKLSQFSIPEHLPALGAPLGFLRPDAAKSRKDVEIVIEDYLITEHGALSILTGRNGIQAALQQKGWEYMARVDWRVRWDYDLEKRGGICEVDDVKTTLTVTYALPKWQPSKVPHPGLKTYWDQFERALWVHEYGHAKIGYDAKKEIQNRLMTANLPESNCQRLAKTLNQIARDIINRDLDKTYDAVTDHGQTQGAVYDVQDARQAIQNYKDGSRTS